MSKDIWEYISIGYFGLMALITAVIHISDLEFKISSIKNLINLFFDDKKLKLEMGENTSFANKAIKKNINSYISCMDGNPNDGGSSDRSSSIGSNDSIPPHLQRQPDSRPSTPTLPSQYKEYTDYMRFSKDDVESFVSDLKDKDKAMDLLHTLKSEGRHSEHDTTLHEKEILEYAEEPSQGTKNMDDYINEMEKSRTTFRDHVEKRYNDLKYTYDKCSENNLPVPNSIREGMDDLLDATKDTLDRTSVDKSVPVQDNSSTNNLNENNSNDNLDDNNKLDERTFNSEAMNSSKSSDNVNNSELSNKKHNTDSDSENERSTNNKRVRSQ